MYKIEPFIRQAATLPPAFYQDAAVWELCKEEIFGRTWQYIGDQQQLFSGMENLVPLRLLADYLDEPLLLTKQEEQIRCLTNVCTHRGFLLVQYPTRFRKIICQYHGRRFNLEGQFEFMPEFEEAENFPRPCDDLHELALYNWRQFLFTTIGSKRDFSAICHLLEERLGFLPVESFRPAPELSKSYNIRAHWALYCDNYLEGFHIPFVHKGLGSILDYGSYTTLCYDQMILQIGYSNDGSFTFDLPEEHPDSGKRVTAYYYFIFPNFMLNFYPWGLQVNIVRPVKPNFTRVEFLYYIYDDDLFEHMQGLQLAEKTEREDEFVVEAVQRGIGSRFYKGGRFSPKREQGVHHFHSLIAEYLSGYKN